MTLVRGAMKHAQDMGFDTLMIDTAGRLHVDDELMVELERIKAEQNRSNSVLSRKHDWSDAVVRAESFTNVLESPASF